MGKAKLTHEEEAAYEDLARAAARLRAAQAKTGKVGKFQPGRPVPPMKERALAGFLREVELAGEHIRRAQLCLAEYEASIAQSGDAAGGYARNGVAAAAADPAREGEEIRAGLCYGGRGPGGEFYAKRMGPDESEAIWVADKNGPRWTSDDLEAIARDMRLREMTVGQAAGIAEKGDAS